MQWLLSGVLRLGRGGGVGELASKAINITTRFHLNLRLRKRGTVSTLRYRYSWRGPVLNTEQSSTSLRY
jgi:hypothetical protein